VNGVPTGMAGDRTGLRIFVPICRELPLELPAPESLNSRVYSEADPEPLAPYPQDRECERDEEPSALSIMVAAHVKAYQICNPVAKALIADAMASHEKRLANARQAETRSPLSVINRRQTRAISFESPGSTTDPISWASRKR